MKTTEILELFLKGGDVCRLSEKQHKWLTEQAKREKVKTSFCGKYLYCGDAVFNVRSCKVHYSAYGGFVGTRQVQGRYILERLTHIRFRSTGLTQLATQSDLKYVAEQGHEYDVINTSEEV